MVLPKKYWLLLIVSFSILCVAVGASGFNPIPKQDPDIAWKENMNKNLDKVLVDLDNVENASKIYDYASLTCCGGALQKDSDNAIRENARYKTVKYQKAQEEWRLVLLSFSNYGYDMKIIGDEKGISTEHYLAAGNQLENINKHMDNLKKCLYEADNIQ